MKEKTMTIKNSSKTKYGSLRKKINKTDKFQPD